MSVSIIEWGYLCQLDEERPLGWSEPEIALRVVQRGANVFASGSPLKPEAIRLLDEFLDDPALLEKLEQPLSREAVLLKRVHALQRSNGPADGNPQPEQVAA